MPDVLLEEIGELEVLGFTQRLVGKHCKKLAESIGMPEEALNAILVENDKAPVFDTQGMIRDWISNEECSNFEKRHRLNVAVTKVCREDLKGNRHGQMLLFCLDPRIIHFLNVANYVVQR